MHMEISKSNNNKLIVIESDSNRPILDFKELKQYRDLFYFMVWREIKVLYAQTILGFSWAILQPLVQIVIFTIIFGKVAKVSSEGFPYLVFSTVAIIPWTYMSQALSQSSQSLVGNQGLLGKIYFPRIIFPITPVLARLVDFCISLIIILFVMLYYKITPTWNLIFLPLFIVLMVAIPTSIGMIMSALAIRFRDVRHAMPFVVRLLIYSAPILYSASSIPAKYRFIYSLNPIVSVIEGFRACLLGTTIQWMYIWPGMCTVAILLVVGLRYFKNMERIFVDVI